MQLTCLNVVIQNTLTDEVYYLLIVNHRTSINHVENFRNCVFTNYFFLLPEFKAFTPEENDKLLKLKLICTTPNY